MEDHKMCLICHEDMTYRKPRMLPCVHSYCTECLEKLFKQPIFSRKGISCPQCRLKVKIESISKLPINFLLTPTKDVDKKPSMCTVCKDENTIARCRECAKDLCRNCRNEHYSVKGFQNHNLKNLNPDVCLEHKEAIKYVCMFCDKDVCSSCTFGEAHSGHRKDIVTIGESCEKLIKIIRSKSIQMQKHLKNKLSHLKDVLEKCSVIKADITTYADNLLKILSQEINCAKNKLIGELSEKESIVKEHILPVENSLKRMEKASEVCKGDRFDSEFYSTLKCLDSYIEADAETARQLFQQEVTLPKFEQQSMESVCIGRLQQLTEHLDNYPPPKYEENPYSLDKISVCTDTIYELFLSRKRAEEDLEISNYSDVETSRKGPPPIKQKPKIQKPKETEYESFNSPPTKTYQKTVTQKPPSLTSTKAFPVPETSIDAEAYEDVERTQPMSAIKKEPGGRAKSTSYLNNPKKTNVNFHNTLPRSASGGVEQKHCSNGDEEEIYVNLPAFRLPSPNNPKSNKN